MIVAGAAAERRRPGLAPMRLDLALFSLRLFTSRSRATAAIQDGEALLNGARAKPSQELRAGDRVTLIGPLRSRTFEVCGLPAKSLSREAAKALVREILGPEAPTTTGS